MVAKNKSIKVLLVDRDVSDLMLLKKSLESHQQHSFSIHSANSVRQAFRKIQKTDYDIVLASCRLRNEEEGLDLLRQIKSEDIQLPFVLMTPIEDDVLVREAMQQGVADVIIKNKSQYNQLANKIKESYESFIKQCNRRVTDTPESGELFTEEESNPLKMVITDTSIRDELTGVFNHGYMHQRIVGEFARATRYSYPLSCLMLDIDNFKKINEAKGYAIGDALLKEAAQLLFENCRLSDVVARYGGTEFLILLPHISYDGALQVAKRLRKTFANHSFQTEAGVVRLTTSIGISSYPEDSMSCRSDLITYADRALKHAKALGRDRCVLFREKGSVLQTAMPKIEMAEDGVKDFHERIHEVAERARNDYMKLSRDLVEALERKDTFTAGHGAQCAKYARMVAEAMGLSPDEVEVIESGNLLHDVGKICIPDEILLKKGKLDFSEYEMIKQHTYFGYKMLKPIKFLKEEALIALHHHEWFNGEGYPCHLKGEEIPIGARICGAIDAYDTMRQAGGRYKKTTTVESACQELIDLSGVQFDPKVVKAFLEVLEKKGELDVSKINLTKLDIALENFYFKGKSKLEF